MCGYEVPGIVLLQAYLCTYNLLRSVTFQVPPLSSYALRPMTMPLLETFLELLLWYSFQYRRHILFGRFRYPKIFVPLRQTIFGNS
jgi:hypothetical protein